MKNWSLHIASLWANILNNRITNGNTIVEFASGGTYKVGLGLSQLGWRGRLFVVEPEPLALFDTMSAYKLLLPNCDLIPIQSRLSDFQLESFDLLVANHPLDDMIIGNALSVNQFNRFFNDHYQKPIDQTKALWNSLTNIHTSVKLSVDEVVAFTKRAKQTVISQYASYFFTSNGFTKPDDIAFEALQAISNEIYGNLFRNNRWMAA